jgi:predicted metalloprotease with PDZ domain
MIYSVPAGGSVAVRPTVEYKITVNASDLSGFDVEMRFAAERSPVRIAMASHPEYDDRYWRYIENFSARSGGRVLNVAKPENEVWRIDAPGGELAVRYRLRLPASTGEARDAWKPFLTPTGGMVGDLHSLMYVVGETSRPARLTLDLPPGWSAAAGLETASDGHTFAASTELMLDAPVMIGELRQWDFNSGGVPHKIVVWSPPGKAGFDAGPLVDGVRRIVEQAVAALGRPPYARYAFLFQNDAVAGLEHLTSVNIGHPFDRGTGDLFPDVAHEYFHAWNLMDVRPKERVGLRYKFAPPTGTLWWGEGATIFFSDLLVRRAGLSADGGTRAERLATDIGRYLSSPGYWTLSAEQVSRGDTDPLAMGDNFASTHLQGELLAAMLDIKIRDASAGRDDLAGVMRLLSRRFDYRQGIANRDIERAVQDVCKCEGVNQFFRDHIYGAKRIDFESYLGLIGMSAVVSRAPAVGADGKPMADARLSPMQSDSGFRVRINNPQSIWGRAGLHSGDRLLSVDGNPVSGWTDLRTWLGTLKIGDVGRVEIERGGKRVVIDVPVTGYDRTTVRIVEKGGATKRQIMLRDAWLAADRPAGVRHD